MRRFPYSLWLVWSLLLALGSVSSCSRADEMAEFAKALNAEEALPRVEISGRFDFFSATESETLVPMSDSAFRGTIDLASRRCFFEFKDFRRKVASDRKPYETSDTTVVFDGEKWVVTRTPHDRQGMPGNLHSFTEISATRPGMFLKSLDHLCFPIFGQLLDVTEDGEKQVPLVEFLKNPKAGKREVEMSRAGNEVSVTVKSGIVTEKFLFDASKGNVLKRRATDYDRYNRSGDRSIRNELVVSEVVAVGGRWFPKTALFRQFEDSKVVVERRYTLDHVAIGDKAAPIFASIPPYSMVTDERRPDTPPWSSSDSSAPLFNGL